MLRLVTASIALLGLVGACSASSNMAGPTGLAAPAASGEVAGMRDGQTALRVGQTLAIGLTSNSTTGYLWSVSGHEGSVLSMGQPFGEEIIAAHAPGRVGVGGETRWRFVAARPGEVTLSFVYRRPWEGDVPPGQRATYRVVVR